MSPVISKFPHLGPITIPVFSKTLSKNGYAVFSDTVQKMNPQVVIDWFVMSELWAEWLASKHFQKQESVSGSKGIAKPSVSKKQTVTIGKENPGRQEIKFGGFGIPNITTTTRPVPSVFQDFGSWRSASPSPDSPLVSPSGSIQNENFELICRPAHAVVPSGSTQNAKFGFISRPQSILRTEPSINRIQEHKKAIQQEGQEAAYHFIEGPESDYEDNQSDGSDELAPRFATNGSPLRRFGPPATDVFTPPKFLDHSTKIWSTSAAERAYKTPTYLPSYDNDWTRKSVEWVTPSDSASHIAAGSKRKHEDLEGEEEEEDRS